LILSIDNREGGAAAISRPDLPPQRNPTQGAGIKKPRSAGFFYASRFAPGELQAITWQQKRQKLEQQQVQQKRQQQVQQRLELEQERQEQRLLLFYRKRPKQQQRSRQPERGTCSF
jgi:hypothetical protein